MHRDDWKLGEDLLAGALYSIRGIVILPVVFLGYVALLPVQLLSWMRNKTPWGQTQPYLFLHYLLTWSEALRKDEIPHYREWKRKKVGDKQ